MGDAVPADLARLSAAAAARMIAARQLSALELTDALLARIVRREPDVAAWAHLDPGMLRHAARAADAGPTRGPLHGVPVAVKDVIDTADYPTECASPIFAGQRPAADALCVARLRAAGAIVMGKTVTTEFAYARPGPTRNPHDLRRTPGGSSSGSAAAVADHMAPVALGTQTGGSTIRPAAFCGVIGYKPGFGRWATRGLHYLAPSLDTIGLFAREIEDVALISPVLAGGTYGGAQSGVAPRFVLFAPDQMERAEPQAWARVEETARAAGSICARRLDVGDAFARLHAAHRTIMAAEVARSFATLVRERRSDLSPELAAFIDVGLSVDEAGLADAWAALAAGRRWFAREVAPGEILLTLPAAGEAPHGLASTGDATFNRVWTLLGAACLTLPAGRGEAGLPLGVQLVDPHGGEHALLAAAHWLARERLLAVPEPPR